MTADLHPDTGLPRPDTCCGACPPIAGGGWDCTCAGLPECPVTAADRPSVTDIARAEAIKDAAAWLDRLYPNGLIAKKSVLADLAEWADRAKRGLRASGREWAAGRAETTTELYPCLPSLGEPCGNCHRCTDPAETTTADAQTGTFEAILAAHRDEYDSDCGMYFGCSCGWDNDDIGSNEGYVEHVAGLLATARTRPTREQVIDALVMSPLSDTAGTDMRPFEQTADAVLALLEGGDRDE